MPELPEVEVVRRGLESLVLGQPQILAIQFRRRDLREAMPVEELKKLVGARILAVTRRAKYLHIFTSKGNILSHLGMTGNWRNDPSENLRVHDHIVIRLSNGVTLIYSDPRRFGMFELAPEDLKKSKRIAGLGPEPLEDSFTWEVLFKKSRKRNSAVKTFIMDQKNVVGVGNIYACEALFRAKIKPTKKASTLTREQCSNLVAAIKLVLLEAIRVGGSSIQDFKSAQQETGYFQNQFHVYGKVGELCVKCATPIKSKVIGGRNSFWCPTCQR